MKLDLDTSAGDEVAEIIHALALLRRRCRHAGPMVTSRIWKAEMQMKNLARELSSESNDKSAEVYMDSLARYEAHKSNERRFRRLCPQPRREHRNYPQVTGMTPRPQ